MSLEEAADFGKTNMNLIVGSKMQKFSDYLLAEGSPRVQRHYRELLGQRGDVLESLQATWGIVPPESSKNIEKESVK